MRRWIRQGALLLAALLVIAAWCPAASAADGFSLTVRFALPAEPGGGEAVPLPGAKIAVYRVADVSLRVLDEYRGAGVESLDGLSASGIIDAAERLAGYVTASGRQPDAVNVTGADGAARFPDIPAEDQGVYLVILQGEVTTGRTRVSFRPFLVQIPMPQEDGFLTDVTANPKPEAVTAPSTAPKTGDTNQPGLYLALVLLSCGAAAGLIALLYAPSRAKSRKPRP